MNIKKKYKIFSEISGGDLLPIEFFDLPFAPKRVFTVTNVPKNEIRGQHAHYETEQIFICTNGSILVGLDDGKTKEEVILLKGDGVLIKKMTWDWQKFLTGYDSALVICSTTYDTKDYIENISDFHKIIKN